MNKAGSHRNFGYGKQMAWAGKRALRGDRHTRIAPAALVGQRSLVRTQPPAHLDRQTMRQCARQLRMNAHEHIASVV
jgi:hypothetical protein